MVIDAANMKEYTKEIDTMTSERARLDMEVKESLFLSRQRQGQDQEKSTTH